MPHTKSTSKRLRQSKIRRTYNRAVRTRMRNVIKTARGAEGADAATHVSGVYANLDRAVKRGVVTRRHAARIKSRLALRANREAAG